MSKPVAKALWGHYRRHPFQILLVWLGLTLGIALLIGVMAINQQARESYRQGEQLFDNPFPYRIRSLQSGMKVPQGFYIDLRRAGFKECVPIDEHRITTEQQRDFELLGVDPIAMFSTLKSTGPSQPQLFDLITPPYPILIGEQLARYIGVQDGEMITLDDGMNIGPLRVVSDERIGGPRMIADMALLRQISRSSGFTAVICREMSSERIRDLEAKLPSGMGMDVNQSATLEPLTNAFHLNLFAMGMLSFVVGLFIFYQAMSLSLSQRQPLVGLLRQMGVSGYQLSGALAIEILLWVILGLVGGNLLGLLLAQQLLPSVAATLSDLYGANVNLAIEWHWQWGLASLAIAVFGSVLACGWPALRLIKTQPLRLATRMSLIRISGREFAFQAIISCFFIGAAYGVYQLPHGQTAGFVLIAFILVACGLMMPFILWQFFRLLAKVVKAARLRWFFSDAAASLSYRGVAAMAFMLALASNIGMETMVGSFRYTTENWLGQRLAADIYVRPPLSVATRLETWLEQQPEVDQVWRRWRKELDTHKGIVELRSIGHSQGEKAAMAVKVATPDYWAKTHSQRAVMVSESMALREGWKPGDIVNLPAPLGKGWHISAVYYDYGNPHGQLLLSQRNWQKLWQKKGAVGFAIHLKEGESPEPIMARMGERFRLQPERVRNNAELMNQAMRVFDRTFVVTSTLGKLTLFISVCGLFVATVAGEVSRQRQFALLRCMGMTGRELAMLGGGQLFIIGLLTALMALPLGLVLAQLLIDVVLKYSFGWTMELYFFPSQYLVSLSAALVVLLAAGAWPVWRLVKRSAITSLRESF
ncbi:ABC transporter permease [Photobacterium jeanii]|uniref:ABC transporter permease n=1 Tax=Photobacterium jeanii TaxID=858640 RepID=A0A178KKT3_9GAMM|nr:ABC transporter permease [Photobacterium jeanii]OAN17736.1 ABC transporter permease [Photobacterium jeanii]PST92602.1 ABC transporter permease [Photobacterium jeanii]